MGLQYRFTCPDCDYAAVVGGGVGTGEMAQLKTIHCLDCREVYDVQCAKLPFDRRNKRAGYSFVPTPSRCPKSAGHRWEDWTTPYLCPRCGRGMRRGEVEVIWD